jgi:hypothetical protein
VSTLSIRSQPYAASHRPVAAPSVWVLVLNYDSLDDTLACVESVRQSNHPHLCILVIDNASPDGSGRRLAEALPREEFVQLPRNTGYAGGNNTGIEIALRAGADHVLILNPDVRVEPGTIAECVSLANAADDVGAINPVQVGPDGHSIDSKFFRTVLRPSGCLSSNYATAALPRVIEAKELLGAALFLPRRALERVGGFDPLYFAYGEETDLCRRLRHHGLRMLVAGHAAVRHLRTKETGGVSDFVLFLRLKGLYLGLLKDPGRSLGSAVKALSRRAMRDVAGLSRGEYPFNQYPVTRWHAVRAMGWVLKHLPAIRRHRVLEEAGRAHV